MLTDTICQSSINILRSRGSPYRLYDATDEYVWAAFHEAECARRHGEFGLARGIIDAIEAAELFAEDSVRSAVGRHRDKLRTNDTSPIDTADIAQSPPSIIDPPVIGGHTPPHLWIRGWNFAVAMARWAGSNFQMRTQQEIEERLAICQACEFLQNNECTKCGCTCEETKRVLNKLAIATEKCPLGKWE